MMKSSEEKDVLGAFGDFRAPTPKSPRGRSSSVSSPTVSRKEANPSSLSFSQFTPDKPSPIQRTSKMISIKNEATEVRIEHAVAMLNEMYEQQERLENQIEDSLNELLLITSSEGYQRAQETVTKIENLQDKMDKLETDIASRSATLLKLKKEWRKKVISYHIENLKSQLHKEVSLRFSQTLANEEDTTSSADSLTGGGKISNRKRSNKKAPAGLTKLSTGGKSNSNPELDSGISSGRKWDIPSRDLDIDYSQLIGRGQFGAVYKGRLLGKEVAIKKISFDLDRETLEEFIKEVSIMVTLRHPNILLFIGACTEPGNMSIVTELMTRGSLHDLLHPKNGKCKISYKRKFLFAKETAQGMNWLHQMEPALLHLDLKTANLLIDEHWVLKVSDFGFSRMRNSETPDRIVGTPSYMANEVMMGRQPTTKSDVYSFGVILWELLTEKIPYENRFTSFDDMIESITMDHVRPDIPNDTIPLLKSLIESCWNSDPGKRPSFKSMLQDNIFDHIIIDGMLSDDPMGKILWKDNFFGRWSVSWKDFLGGFVSSLDIMFEKITSDDLLNCIKPILVSTNDDEEIVTIETFNSFLRWVGPLSKGSEFVNKICDLLSKPYFHGPISQQSAERALSSKKKKGTFLIRLSTHEQGGYAISWVNKEEMIQHTHMQYIPGHGYLLYGQLYHTLDDLVISKNLKTLKPKIKLKIPCQPTPYSHLFNPLINKRRGSIVIPSSEIQSILSNGGSGGNLGLPGLRSSKQ